MNTESNIDLRTEVLQEFSRYKDAAAEAARSEVKARGAEIGLECAVYSFFDELGFSGVGNQLPYMYRNEYFVYTSEHQIFVARFINPDKIECWEADKADEKKLWAIIFTRATGETPKGFSVRKLNRFASDYRMEERDIEYLVKHYGS